VRAVRHREGDRKPPKDIGRARSPDSISWAEIVEIVAAAKSVHDHELEERWTINQIRLSYYLLKRDDYRRLRAAARLTAEAWFKLFLDSR
jgi:hypothetical protein